MYFLLLSFLLFCHPCHCLCPCCYLCPCFYKPPCCCWRPFGWWLPPGNSPYYCPAVANVLTFAGVPPNFAVAGVLLILASVCCEGFWWCWIPHCYCTCLCCCWQPELLYLLLLAFRPLLLSCPLLLGMSLNVLARSDRKMMFLTFVTLWKVFDLFLRWGWFFGGERNNFINKYINK